MLTLTAEVNDAAQTVRFTATRNPGAEGRLVAGIDGVAIIGVEADEAGPRAAVLSFATLRLIHSGELTLKQDGMPLPTAALRTEGSFFEAISLGDADLFHERVQLNHSRYTSRLLLELAARCAHGRFAGDVVTQSAALTILGHRYIERLAPQREPAEEARIEWLLARAAPLVTAGAARLAAPRMPDWREVRWSVSLATVAGYLHLARGEHAAAREMFSLPRHSLHHVGLSKVSALNMVVGCFLHGLLSHMLGEPDTARESLHAGIEGVKPVVMAQELAANVWVIGDLINVMRVGRQCFIALVRLGLLPADGAEPIIEPGSVFTLAEVTGPLPHMLRLGLLPRLQEHVLRHEGR